MSLMQSQRSGSAFSLLELLIALSITATVAGVCIGSYVTLQRGFIFLISWSDLGNAISRVQDSIEVDLRNATQISITTDSPVQKLTLTVPQAYTDYYSSGARAGDPSVGMTSTTINSTTGALVYVGGTMTVVYSGTTPSPADPLNPNERIINRTAIWSGSTATRTVATFKNGACLSYFLMTSATDGSLTPSLTATSTSNVSTSGTIASNTSAVCILISGTTNDHRRPLSSGTLQDLVYLRAFKL